MAKKPDQALRFVLLLGVVSLLSDMTYESARSINGPYLGLLGGSAAVVGTVAGLGELIGYGLRILSGLLTDKTRRYWTITILGYALNLLAVPALALAGNWEAAAILIMAERLGKAVRTPARDAMLSHAAHSMGRGWAFGLHEAMDQVGAMTGPMIVAAVLAWKGSYRLGYAVLLAPALLALGVLAAARITHPRPRDLEPAPPPGRETGFPPAFYLYLAASACMALGFADFPLAAFHMKKTGMFPDQWIPMIYAGAMGVDALSALLLGRWFDKRGLPVLMAVTGLTAFSAPLVFLSGKAGLLLGMGLWGVGLGAQESIVRAVVAGLVPKDRRGTGFGIFNSSFGLAWFLGSSAMGLLYERSLPGLAAFSLAAQLASLPLLFLVRPRPGQKT